MKVNNEKKYGLSRILLTSVIFLLILSNISALGAIQVDNSSDATQPELDSASISTDALLPGINTVLEPAQPRGHPQARQDLHYLTVNPQGVFSPSYLGDQNNEFFFFVTENYDGSYYEHVDDIPEGTQHNLSLWNITLESIEFYWNGNLLTPEESPVDWIIDVPDNNNDFGWLAFDSVNFYHDSTLLTMFSFNVKSSNIQTGMYEARIIFQYRLMKNYTLATNQYNFTQFGGIDYVSEVVSLNFEVRSCMSYTQQPVPVNENNNLINNGQFFAGAVNQKLRIYFDENYPGNSLEDVQVILIPPSFMEIYKDDIMKMGNNVSLNFLDSNTPFYWRVNIDTDVNPGIYHGTQVEGYISYEYTRTDNMIKVQEINKYTLDFFVGYTPIVVPPATDGMTGEVPPELQILKGTPSILLEINFTNHGNINLYDIELGLDLSNSFLQAPYYYDASAGDLKTDLVVSDNSINELHVGENANAMFNLNIFQDLPKGKYLVPLVYSAWYYNNGSLGTPSGWVKTTETDYTMIRETHQVSVIDTIPHLAVEILNPTPDITLETSTVTTYFAGALNQRLDLKMSNYELYSFQNVTISIDAGASSPFEDTVIDQGTPNMINKVFNSIAEGSKLNPYETTFSVLVNIKPDASGYYSVPVEISGWDVFNDDFNVTTILEVTIQPQLPEFIIINSKNSKVKPGQNFTLDITVKNVGGSDANSLSLLLMDMTEFSNTFTVGTDGIIQVGNLQANGDVSLRFNVTVDENITLGLDYQISVRFKYMDILGTIHGFNDNPAESINIRTYFVKPTPATEVFLVTQVQSQDVAPGSSVKLTITLKNIGERYIVGADATLVSNSNLFTIAELVSGASVLGPFTPDEEKTLEFDIAVAKSAKRGEEYTFRLLLKYEDETGQKAEYNTSDWHEVTVRIKDAAPAKEEDRTNWELVSVGVLILIAVIIFVLLLGVILRHGGIVLASAPTEGREARGRDLEDIEKGDEARELPSDEEIESVESEFEEMEKDVKETEDEEKLESAEESDESSARKVAKPISARPAQATAVPRKATSAFKDKEDD